jgi:hypothetical protein
MKPKMRNRRLRCAPCRRTTEHVPIGRPVGGGERARAVGLVLAAFIVSLCVVAALALLSRKYLREFFALVPPLTRDVVLGGVGGAVGVGGPVLLAGQRRVQIALHGQYYDWQCSLCGRVRPPRR